MFLNVLKFSHRTELKLKTLSKHINVWNNFLEGILMQQWV